MPTPILHTERLILRPLMPDDAPALFDIFSRPQAMRFMPIPPHQTITETRETLIQELAISGAHHWVICLRDNERPIGHLNFLGQTRLPGLGYILHPDWWGLGLTAEACRAVITHGFDELGYERIELWINEQNLASQRLAQKLGFRVKGTLPQKYNHNPRHHIMLVYGLLAEEWRGQAPVLSEDTPAVSTEVRFFWSQPVLTAYDVGATAAFYRDKLGFQIDFLYGDPPNHAGVSRGDWNGSMVSLQLTQIPPERQIISSGYLYILVDTRLDDLCEQYRANGVEVVDQPTSYPWGLREFSIRDLNGHWLRFGTHL